MRLEGLPQPSTLNPSAHRRRAKGRGRDACGDAGVSLKKLSGQALTEAVPTLRATAGGPGSGGAAVGLLQRDGG
eukprot:66582-Chlamydomonas_euryale.AAC.2